MEKFIIKGGNKLKGTISASGAKNIAPKALLAACLTSEEVIIHNVPIISDFLIMTEVVKELGGEVKLHNHSISIKMRDFKTSRITLERAAEIRSSIMFIAPLLARTGSAIVPNPGGCRIGARPIDRTIDGLVSLSADITYHSEDGYYHGKTEGLKGTTYRFEKNTHTGTETLLIAAVLAEGKTVLQNAAQEPEIDELIKLLNQMGARILRTEPRVIEIEGVEKLHGTEFFIKADKNEIVTMAIAAIVTEGDVLIENANKGDINEFLKKLDEVGGGYKIEEKGIRFFYKGPLRATQVTTGIYPGFMTDWQSPWAVLMTKAIGESIIHETVYEYRFGYVKELRKMGAKIELFNPEVEDPERVYNFNIDDSKPNFFHGIKITGPVKLHDAVLTISDLRAGATLVLAALAAKGTSTIFGLQHIDRGYEKIDARLRSLGTQIVRAKDEI